MNPNEPIRKRIVINLDEPGPGGQAYTSKRSGRRRWPKVLGILFLLVVLGIAGLAVGGFFWWRHFQSTPEYSLALLIDAAQKNDMSVFQKQVDYDAIARNMVTDVSQKATNRYGLAMNASLQQQIDTLLPTLLPRIKDTIDAEVTKEIKEFASKSEPKPFILVALAVPKLVTVTREGDNAKVSVPTPDRSIELGMTRDGDHWKVTGFKDEELTQRVVDSVMKDLPAIGKVDLSNIPLLKGQRKSKRRR
jgi:hypothetical protein